MRDGKENRPENTVTGGRFLPQAPLGRKHEKSPKSAQKRFCPAVARSWRSAAACAGSRFPRWRNKLIERSLIRSAPHAQAVI
jgi:hypothetical protein